MTPDEIKALTDVPVYIALIYVIWKQQQQLQVMTDKICQTEKDCIESLQVITDKFLQVIEKIQSK